jgi:hypothetical protein
MPAARVPRTAARRKPKLDSHRRGQHLTFIRQLPCVACGRAAPSEPAHVRTGTDGGVGIKPSDRYSVPLCTACHAKQHRVGELRFWSACASIPSMWPSGCGSSRPISRPASALYFGRDSTSIWRRHLAENHLMVAQPIFVMGMNRDFPSRV